MSEEKNKGEEVLKALLKALDDNVFILRKYEDDDFEMREEKLPHCIEDRDGTIVIQGEWDREDLKKILLSLVI